MKHLERAFVGNNHFGLYIVVIIVVFFVQNIVSIVTLVAAELFTSGNIEGLFLNMKGAMAVMNKNILLSALLIPFAISLGVMLILIRLLHKRTFTEVVNGRKKARWKRVWVGFAIWFILMGIYTIVSLIIRPDDLTLQFNIDRFIPLLIISIILIPLQTTFEEVMVRGYFAQGVGTLTRNRWLALILPALFFSLLHIANPEIEEYGMGIMLATYFTMALILGLTSILDDGIELAMGMHAANNLFICLFTSQQGAAFETYAVFEIAKSNPYVALVELIVMGAIILGICYRKYNWSFATLNKKIEKADEASSTVS